MKRIWRATGNANITATEGTLVPGVAFQIEEVRFHLAADGGDNNFVMTQSSDTGTAYRTVLLTQNTNGVTDIIYQPDRPHAFEAGDGVVFTWTNANTRVYGLEVYYSAI